MTTPHFNLTFHGLGDFTPHRSLDQGEKDVWLPASRFTELLDALASRKNITITFDDGNASDATIALPELKKRNLTATFFILAARIDQPGSLSRTQLLDLKAAGMPLGVHGFSHRPWATLTPDQLTEELVSARKTLEDATAHPLTTAACPFGSYNRRTLAALKAAGYTRVYTSDKGPATPTAWLQPRTTLRNTDTPASLANLLKPPTPLATAIRNTKILIKSHR